MLPKASVTKIWVSVHALHTTLPDMQFAFIKRFPATIWISVRSFEKGLADRRGWREQILHMPEIQASFLYPFSYAPSGEQEKGDTFLENFLGSFWGFVCRQPPPANPFSSKPLIQPLPPGLRWPDSRESIRIRDRKSTHKLFST